MDLPLYFLPSYKERYSSCNFLFSYLDDEYHTIWCAVLILLNAQRALHFTTRTPHVGANAWLLLLLENSKSIKRHNYVQKILRVTCLPGMGSPFNSKQLV